MIRATLLAFASALTLAACAEETPVAPPRAAPAEGLEAAASAREIAGGELSAVAATRMALERIAAFDRQGPEIQAVIALNPNAMAEAEALDADRAAGRIRGPLHGVPVLVKDNVETQELPTTAGSLALAANDTGRDAPIIARLRDAGAIILGKTNLSEWANFRSTNSISGWSGVGGQTRNPYSLDRSPCGSSSGSGAAVAAGYVPLAIGTETNGSILCPAAMNGIVGVKPTVGLLSRTHIVPISASQDTAGPMARSVADAALMLMVMAGSDPDDPATAEADRQVTDYPAALGQGIAGMRIGVLRPAVGEMPEVSEAFEAALGVLEAQGAVLVEIEEFSVPEEFWGQALTVLETEFKDGVNAYLADAAPDVEARDLEALIAFNEEHAAREMALFGQELFTSSQEKGSLESEEYITARDAIQTAARGEGIDRLLSENDVAVIVAPERPPAFMIDPVLGDQYPEVGIGATYLAAIAGYPSLTVPMGMVDGLPVGLGVMAGPWSEATILRVGHAYETARDPLPGPGFAQSGFFHPDTASAMRPVAGAER